MMTTLTLGDVANVISVIPRMMTILGITGVVTWGLFSQQRGSFAQNTISVFATSVKMGLCVLLLWPTSALFFALHIFVVLSLGPGSIADGEMFWRPDYPVVYVVSYLLNTVLWVPLYALMCACIFTWSFRPFRTFWLALRGQRSGEKQPAP